MKKEIIEKEQYRQINFLSEYFTTINKEIVLEKEDQENNKK